MACLAGCCYSVFVGALVFDLVPFTTSQLQAWAGLGPWEWQKLAEFSSPKHSLGPGVLLTDERDGTPWGDTIDQTNAALIAAAPALAAALLAERKAREVEVGELRAAAEDLVSLCSADVKMNGTTYQPMPYRSAFTKAVERVIEALKGPTP
jgi:hypothetical protein